VPKSTTGFFSKKMTIGTKKVNYTCLKAPLQERKKQYVGYFWVQIAFFKE
jgi:hypothetical protein